MAEEQELYWNDILLWSEQQADLLRRLARGERVKGVDWDHVIEEIEDVGKSELHSVQSFLRQAMAHLLERAAWPPAEAPQHWLEETVMFLTEAESRFAPSMAQAINLQRE